MAKSRFSWRRLLKPAGYAFAVVGLLCVLVLYMGGGEGSGQKALQKKVRGRRNLWGEGSGEKIHVALCSDDPDLRPAAVAINSAHVNAADPDRLVFHFITSPELAPVFKELFRVYLEDIVIEVHADQQLQDRIASHIHFRASSKARRVLASPFNFAPFYIHEYIASSSEGDPSSGTSPSRLIYIDTDTVIMGDLAELYDTDLQGHPCAAVKYCLQTMDRYINTDAIRALGVSDYDPKACIANRGLLVIDVQRWVELELTEKIQMWMDRYAQSTDDLWAGGMSQPPWLLAMNGDYLELGDEWNCNSLGRDSMGPDEAYSLRQAGFDHEALRKIGAKFDVNGNIAPYVVSCSATGKLLHYNGAVKPWNYGRFTYGAKLPACALPENFPEDHVFTWKTTVRIFCKLVTFVNCVELWTAYIAEDVACALRDYEQEWPEEAQWDIARQQEAHKVDNERQSRKQERLQKQEKEKDEIRAMENSKEKLGKSDVLAREAAEREQEAETQRAQMEQTEALSTV